MSFTIKVDAKEVELALDKLDAKTNKRTIGKALAKGAKFLKPKVKAATPTGPGHFGYHLKNRVSAGAAKKNKPAAIVKYRSSREHFLIAGTKGHSTKPVRSGKSAVQTGRTGGVQHFSRGHQVTGAKANPIISRVANQYGDEAVDVAERELARSLGLDD